MSCSKDFNSGFDYRAPCNGLPLDSGFSQTGGGASCVGIGYDMSNQIAGHPAIQNYAPNCIHGQYGGMRKNRTIRKSRKKYNIGGYRDNIKIGNGNRQKKGSKNKKKKGSKIKKRKVQKTSKQKVQKIKKSRSNNNYYI